MSEARRTIDHETIRSWVERHGGHPARVRRTGQGDDPGILRIDFPGFSGEDTLEEISWDEFFAAFEDNGLAFLFQEEGESRFNKLVARVAGDDQDDEARGGARRSRSRSGRGRAAGTQKKTTKTAKSAKSAKARKARKAPSAPKAAKAARAAKKATKKSTRATSTRSARAPNKTAARASARGGSSARAGKGSAAKKATRARTGTTARAKAGARSAGGSSRSSRSRASDRSRR